MDNDKDLGSEDDYDEDMPSDEEWDAIHRREAELAAKPQKREARPYYEALGMSHDQILRCADCQALVLHTDIEKYGCCPKCGNRRLKEITVLSEEESAKIVSGEIDFPHRAEFLAEFSRVE